MARLTAVDFPQRVCRERRRRAIEHYLALCHPNDAITVGTCYLQGMQVTEHRHTIFTVNRAYGIHDPPGVMGIERGDPFVGQNEVRLLD